MTTYLKITNELENHKGFQYKNGLNVLIEPFSVSGSCCAGGLYFTEQRYIHHYYGYGVHIRVVELPINDPDFLMVKDPQGNKWRANKIIFGKKYPLYDLSTYIDLDITRCPVQMINFPALEERDRLISEAWKNSGMALQYPIYESMMNESMMNGSSRDQIDVLIWWSSKQEISCPIHYGIIDYASRYNHIDVLNWFKNSGFGMKCTLDALDIASSNCNIDVLQWWLNSGLELKYSCDSLDYASKNNHINVLQWWLDSGLELKYSCDLLYYASKNNHVNILQWLLDSGLELKYSCDSLDYASKNGHIDVLQWWLDSGLELKYSCDSLDYACKYQQTNVLNWWINSGLSLIYSKYVTRYISKNDDGNPCQLKEHVIKSRYLAYIAQNGYDNTLSWWTKTTSTFNYKASMVYFASVNNIVDLLNWCKKYHLESGTEMEYTKCTIDRASADGHIVVLQWWLDSGLTLKYSERAMDNASRDGRVDVSQWWKESNLKLKYSKHVISKAEKNGHKAVIDWWRNSGLVMK